MGDDRLIDLADQKSRAYEFAQRAGFTQYANVVLARLFGTRCRYIKHEVVGPDHEFQLTYLFDGWPLKVLLDSQTKKAAVSIEGTNRSTHEHYALAFESLTRIFNSDGPVTTDMLALAEEIPAVKDALTKAGYEAIHPIAQFFEYPGEKFVSPANGVLMPDGTKMALRTNHEQLVFALEPRSPLPDE